MLPFVNYRDVPSAGGEGIPGDSGHDTYDVPFVEPEAIVPPFPDQGVQFTDFQGTSSPTGDGPTVAGWSPSIDEALAFERQVDGSPAEGFLPPFAQVGDQDHDGDNA